MHKFIPFQLDAYTNNILLYVSALILIITCIRLAISKNLVESVILMSVFSLLIGICYLLMDAPDVAMTEAALGACLSTCVMLNMIKIVGQNPEKVKKSKIILVTIFCSLLVACLVWAAFDLPNFGAPESPMQNNLTKYYVENTHTDIAIPSMVAAILASYRGYDTLGETIVVLIAGLAVLVITSRKRDTKC